MTIFAKFSGTWQLQGLRGWYGVYVLLFFCENHLVWLLRDRFMWRCVRGTMLFVEFTDCQHCISLKPMYSFGKWWKWKISLMGFVYRVVWALKALWIFLSETINFLRKLHKTNILGCPRKFYHRVMYIAPSSGHISLNLNMLFKFVLRRFEVVFWCLEWECCTFWKIDGNSFKSTNTILWL